MREEYIVKKQSKKQPAIKFSPGKSTKLSSGVIMHDAVGMDKKFGGNSIAFISLKKTPPID